MDSPLSSLEINFHKLCGFRNTVISESSINSVERYYVNFKYAIFILINVMGLSKIVIPKYGLSIVSNPNNVYPKIIPPEMKFAIYFCKGIRQFR